MKTIKCMLREDDETFPDIMLEITDEKKRVYSPKDNDDLSCSSFEDFDFVDDLKKYLNKKDIAELDHQLDMYVENKSFVCVPLDVDETYWTKDGYVIKEKKEWTGKVLSVDVPLSLDGVVTVDCPYCSEPRSVEPDANYTVTCEGCGHKYDVVSMI